MSEGDRAPIPVDAEQFMQGNGRTFMVTLRKDGSPTGHPMAGFFGGALYLNMYGASAKSRNLERDDRICCVVTNPSDARDFEGTVYRGTARKVPAEEVFAEDVPQGLAWARNPRTEGSQDNPEIPPEDERKIGETAGRIKRGVRVIYEIVPAEVGMISSVRCEG
ncbi:MAG: pyridoxamine 5'-phosphate oxidase family protein [Deltaproteobacteria bacterium]|nr:pyridoxamine 5'-phosphate oxidase family protein [Deltaproteobacteria bacterium]